MEPSAPQTPPRISVIIVSYNVRDLLLACIASIPAESTEIIVVDNQSADGTVAAVRAHASHVRVIDNDENVGFARANNQALRLASGSCLVLLNPDTVVRLGALATLAGALEADPALGIAGPALLNPDGSLQSAGMEFPTPWRIVRDHLLRALVPLPTGERRAVGIADCDWVVGACLVTRRDVLDAIGLLDEGYFMYGEEKDLCYRCREAGYRVVCVNEAEVVHYGGQSARQAPLETYLAFLDSQWRFLTKFRPRFQRWLFAGCNYIACRVRQIAAEAIGLLRPRRREEWRGKAAVFAAGARWCLEHLRGSRS